MTKKGLTIVLAVVCALCVVGAAFAASAWFVGAKNEGNNITTGQVITMELTNVSASNNSGLYPGDTATITLTAKNKNVAAVLKVQLVCDDLDSEEPTWRDYIEIKYQVGSESATAYQATGISIGATLAEQSVTLSFTLKAGGEGVEAPITMANQTIKVVISLDKVEA